MGGVYRSNVFTAEDEVRLRVLRTVGEKTRFRDVLATAEQVHGELTGSSMRQM